MTEMPALRLIRSHTLPHQGGGLNPTPFPSMGKGRPFDKLRRG